VTQFGLHVVREMSRMNNKRTAFLAALVAASALSGWVQPAAAEGAKSTQGHGATDSRPPKTTKYNRAPSGPASRPPPRSAPKVYRSGLPRPAPGHLNNKLRPAPRSSPGPDQYEKERLRGVSAQPSGSATHRTRQPRDTPGAPSLSGIPNTATVGQGTANMSTRQSRAADPLPSDTSAAPASPCSERGRGVFPEFCQ
jgi:hypothetical protein